MSDLLSDPDPDRDQAYQHPSVYDIAVPSTSQPGPSNQRLTVQDRNLYPFQPMAQYPLNFVCSVFYSHIYLIPNISPSVGMFQHRQGQRSTLLYQEIATTYVGGWAFFDNFVLVS